MTYPAVTRAAALHVFSRLGESGTYERNGDETEITVIIARQMERAPGQATSQIGDSRYEARWPRSQLSTARRGATIKVDDIRYVVEALVEDDGYVVRAAVRKET